MRLFRNYSKFFKQAIFIFLCTLSVLATTEIALRVLSRLYSRGRILNRVSHSNDFIIVCIGDSFTYGLCVEEQDAYPAQLERMLHYNLSGKHFRVFNLGVPGSNSSMHLKYFTQLVDDCVKPDIAIILTGANDKWNIADSNIDKIMRTHNLTAILKTKINSFIGSLRIYKMVKLIIINITGRFPKTDVGLGNIVFNTKDTDNEYDRLIEYNLRQMSILAKANGVSLIFQNYPHTDKGNCSGTPEEKTAKFFSIPFVNNCSVFQERLNTVSPHELYIYDNCHPNAAGYAIMAKEIYKIIAEKIIGE